MVYLRAIKYKKSLLSLSILVFLAGCASFPEGPSVMALPGQGKDFSRFNEDDYECKNYANQSVGGQSANEGAQETTVKGAALGTVVGAIAGVAIGGSKGAAVGAGSGLLLGTAAGAGAGQESGRRMQQRYDNAYVQCMYAKGHKVPVNGNITEGTDYRSNPPPPPRYQNTTPPPPRNGSYPPPPPSRQGGQYSSGNDGFYDDSGDTRPRPDTYSVPF